VAPIFVDGTGQNRILVVRGANDCLLPADVDAAAPLLAEADCLVLQFEIPLETVYYTVAFAKRHGVRCILNPAPGRPIDLERLAGLDYLMPNETEAEAITGLAADSPGAAERAARQLTAGGIRRVIVTLGANGALAAGPDGVERVPGFRVEAVDTTGAGDAFIGSFATFVAEGLAEREAIRRANLYAAMSTTRVGTQKSFPTREAFEAQWAARGGD